MWSLQGIRIPYPFEFNQFRNAHVSFSPPAVPVDAAAVPFPIHKLPRHVLEASKNASRFHVLCSLYRQGSVKALEAAEAARREEAKKVEEREKRKALLEKRREEKLREAAAGAAQVGIFISEWLLTGVQVFQCLRFLHFAIF